MLKFIKEIDTGLILGQFYGEVVFNCTGFGPVVDMKKSPGFGIEEIAQAEKALKIRAPHSYGVERVFCYLHQDGTKDWVSEKNGKVVGGFRHHRHFK